MVFIVGCAAKQADKLPRELIKAAFDEGIKPDRLLRLRFELIHGAAQAVSSFSLKQSVLSGLPLVHPDWSDLVSSHVSPGWILDSEFKLRIPRHVLH